MKKKVVLVIALPIFILSQNVIYSMGALPEGTGKSPEGGPKETIGYLTEAKGKLIEHAETIQKDYNLFKKQYEATTNMQQKRQLVQSMNKKIFEITSLEDALTSGDIKREVGEGIPDLKEQAYHAMLTEVASMAETIANNIRADYVKLPDKLRQQAAEKADHEAVESNVNKQVKTTLDPVVEQLGFELRGAFEAPAESPVTPEEAKVAEEEKAPGFWKNIANHFKRFALETRLAFEKVFRPEKAAEVSLNLANLLNDMGKKVDALLQNTKTAKFAKNIAKNIELAKQHLDVAILRYKGLSDVSSTELVFIREEIGESLIEFYQGEIDVLAFLKKKDEVEDYKKPGDMYEELFKNLKPLVQNLISIDLSVETIKNAIDNLTVDTKDDSPIKSTKEEIVNDLKNDLKVFADQEMPTSRERAGTVESPLPEPKPPSEESPYGELPTFDS